MTTFKGMSGGMGPRNRSSAQPFTFKVNAAPRIGGRADSRGGSDVERLSRLGSLFAGNYGQHPVGPVAGVGVGVLALLSGNSPPPQNHATGRRPNVDTPGIGM